MAIPKNKIELFNQSQDNFHKLTELINSYSEQERLSDFPLGTMNRNIRDVLAHLYHWHILFLDWYSVGMKGEKPEMPAKGYSWNDTKELNKVIWNKYTTHELIEIQRALVITHSKVQDIIGKHSEEELFTKKHYLWTGSSSLAVYIRSNTLSHYNWAYQLIKKAKKK
jgi:hypothetical protein